MGEPFVQEFRRSAALLGCSEVHRKEIKLLERFQDDPAAIARTDGRAVLE